MVRVSIVRGRVREINKQEREEAMLERLVRRSKVPWREETYRELQRVIRSYPLMLASFVLRLSCNY
jgi:nitroimidazol reductase NimA-like FMN-containing flavoprotein (pyridoxamine 5'-phosphate oxidase superfamily)